MCFFFTAKTHRKFQNDYAQFRRSVYKILKHLLFIALIVQDILVSSTVGFCRIVSSLLLPKKIRISWLLVEG